MAKEIINEEFELPEHLQAEAEEQGFEIEVIDDTPEEDRGRKPLRDRKSTRLNSSHIPLSRMPSSA